MTSTTAALVVGTLLAITFVALGHSENPASSEENAFDPLDSHGGIFRALSWTPAEISRISAYHSLAEYHKLIDLVREKLAESDDIDELSARAIEKFLNRMKPPAALRTLLSKKDKHRMKNYHQRGEIGEAMAILRARLGQLRKKDRFKVLRYFGYPAEDY